MWRVYGCPLEERLPAGSTFRNGWRWAGSDSGNGVSVASGQFPTVRFGDPKLRIINNNRIPFDSSAGCPMDAEQLRLQRRTLQLPHKGANQLLCDGQARWPNENLAPTTCRRLLTPSDGPPIAARLGWTYADY